MEEKRQIRLCRHRGRAFNGRSMDGVLEGCRTCVEHSISDSDKVHI